MSASLVPPALEAKLAALGARDRAIAGARGAAVVVAVAGLGAAGAVAADALFDLPPRCRGGMLGVWAAVVALVAWWRVVRPLRAPAPMVELAARVERLFPDLGERLTTLLEVVENSDPATAASRSLVVVLAAEAEQRTRRLDFTAAAPARPAIRAGATAGGLVVALALTVAFVPGSGERVRRFALPWYTPGPDGSFRVIVSSGDPVVRRGEPVTLAAFLERVRPAAPLPDTAVLVTRDPVTRAEARTPMAGDEAAAFQLIWPAVTEDFEYAVEAGGVRSGWHTVVTGDPVDLADGTSATVRPPEYAESRLAPATRTGFAAVDALQYSRATLNLQFTRAAEEAVLEWRPLDPRTGGNPTAIPVRLSTDRTGGAAEVSVAADGTLVLVLVGERGVRTELATPVHAVPDAEPRFERVVGLTAAPRDARPDDRLLMDVVATDDVGVADVRVEYCVNGATTESRSEPVVVTGAGSPRAAGVFAFSLAKKVRDGETLWLRLRATDTRSVPAARLGPQQAYFPQAGWAVLRITTAARPLIEQDVFAQRDAVAAGLSDAGAIVAEATEELAAVRGVTAPGPLALDQAARLRLAQDHAAKAARRLDDVATLIGVDPDLAGVAAGMRAAANGLLRAAGDALKAAEAAPTRAKAGPDLEAAWTKLAATRTALAGLADRNEATARTRLDRYRLRELAADQTALADRVGKPGASPDELVPAQRILMSRLDDVVARSERLSPAVAVAAGAAVHELAARAEELAAAAVALDAAADRVDLGRRAARTERLAREQGEWATRAEAFARRTETAARAAGTRPLAPDSFGPARDRLISGRTVDAVAEQEKIARELDRLADEFARAAAARADKRDAARQVARWQDDLYRRCADAVKLAPDRVLPPALRTAFADEQAALRGVADTLRIPTPAPDLAKAYDAAAAALATAAIALAFPPDLSAPAPEVATKAAATALTTLADRVPSDDQRRRHTTVRIDHLLNQAASIATAAGDALRNLNRDPTGEALKAVIHRQEKLAGAIRALDLPGLEARQETAAAAADRTAADTRSGFVTDLPISIQDLRRRLETLRQASAGGTPADDLAAQFARLVRKLADEADKLPQRPSDDDLKPLLATGREIARSFAGLTAVEAPTLFLEARDALTVVDQAIRMGTTEPVADLRAKAARAAAAADRFAARVAGHDPDLKRVERIAAERKAAAALAPTRRLPDPKATAEAVRDVVRQIDELDHVRVGRALRAKKQALDALNRLRTFPESDRSAALQQSVAEVVEQLVDEMTKNENQALAAPPPEGPAKDVKAAEPKTGGRLPTVAYADEARELARAQRTIRDATAKAAADLARLPRPADADPLGALAEEISALANSAPAPARGALNRTAAYLRAGDVGAAADALTGAVEGGSAQSQSEGTAREQVAKWATALERVRKWDGNLPVVLSRQIKRRAELTEQVGELAEAVDHAVRDQQKVKSGDKADPTLAKVTAELTQIHDKMGEVIKADAGTNWGGVTPLAREATTRLSRAAADLRGALAHPPPAALKAQSARPTGATVREAQAHMRTSATRLRIPSGPAAAIPEMARAAAALARAAGALALPDGAE